MTSEQLELLLEYINAKALVAFRAAQGNMATQEAYQAIEDIPDQLRKSLYKEQE